MATYRQIHVKVWSSPDFQELSPIGKLVFIHLFSNSHRNEAALYRITFKTIATETDLTVEQVDKAISEMEPKMVKYDREKHIIWVINAVRYQKLSPNEVKAIRKDTAGIDHPFSDDFLIYYEDILSTYEGTPKELDSTSEGIPGKGKGKGKGKKDQDQDLPPEKDFTPYQKITDGYNDTCLSLAKVKAVTENRKTAIGARWKKLKLLDDFNQYFARVEKSDFLTGRKPSETNPNWKADFDWLMNEQNMAKVLEGKYDNRAAPVQNINSMPSHWRTV